MKILGISEIDNDAGVVLLDKHRVVAGISEERLSRIKRHQGFPYKSIEWCLQYSGVSIGEIDYIAIAKASRYINPERFYRYSEKIRCHNYFSRHDQSVLINKVLNFLINRFRNIPRQLKLARKLDTEIQEWIIKNNLKEKVVIVHHHLAHAQCAYWASGFDNSLVVTIDGQGEGTTSEVYIVTNGEFNKLQEIFVPNSLGTFYGAVTKALGFKPARHEGKVTGLAAYANPNKELISEIKKLAYSDSIGSFSAPAIYGNYFLIKKYAKKYGREQVASAFQQVLEDVVEQYISYYVKKYNISNISLAGGVFANVKLNQRIFNIDKVKNIFIFPHMADGGLCYGAAQYVYRKKAQDKLCSKIDNVYWGPDYSDQEIERELKGSNLVYSKPIDIIDKIAEQLSMKKVIGHFYGRMEFGPRSLGNRSILYSTQDSSVNDWLNQRLNRSEFMPFAPATLLEKADECYVGWQGAEFSAEFMTITFSCTEQMQQQSPAVVHVDGTARPQLVSEKTNLRFYQIIKRYYKKTGIPSIVNTSFNMHEEPIVCTPKDAIRSFLDGKLDCLAIGNFFVERS
jgi:carbamoyltransferase